MCEIDLITASLPRSMRLAIATSPSRRGRCPSPAVHADRVVGLVERAGSEIQLRLVARPFTIEVLVAAVRFVGINDLNACAPKALNRSSSSSDEVISEGKSSLTSS